MRTMYDGIAEDAPAIAAIPTAIDLVAGYDDGHYAWSLEDWALFPNSTHVHIAVHATTNSGQVLDVETGDATPEEAVNWVLMRRHAGADPTVYCNTTTWPAVTAAFATHDVPDPHYLIADYDGDPTIPAGAIGKQYKSTARWDESSIAAYWPGVDNPNDPGSVVQTAPTSQEEEMSTTSVNGRAGLSWPTGSRHVVQITYDPADGEPNLRVVLPLTTGPWVAPQAWVPTGGSGTYEIPPEHIAACRGVILEGAPVYPVYDVVAV